MKNLMILFCTAFTFHAFSQKASEEQAIKQLLEKESATWRSGDVKAHADCWAVRPYGKILISTGDGTVLDIPVKTMINPPANAMGKGGTSENTNYKMSIRGNNAWVSHNEVSTSAEGTKTYTYEIRILEKVNNQWKLVGQSIHVYHPK